MQLTFLSNAVRTLSLIGMLGAIEGMSLVKTVQAQANPPNPQAKSVCSAAYFDNPGYMYNPVTETQWKAVDKFQLDPDRMKKGNDTLATITTFSVALDAPLGYVVNKVNGKPVPLSPKIEQAIKREMFRDPSNDNRRRIAELNRKYGKYATFGQNITLLLSPEQQKESAKGTYEFLAYIASVLTPQERQAERDRVTAAGECSPSSLFKPDIWRSVTVDTGTRPDLDKRLREDTSGNTFFK